MNQNGVNNHHQVVDQQLVNNRLSMVGLNPDHSDTLSLMPINVKSMLLNGVSDKEVARNWLSSIKCQEYLSNFIDNGYDMHILTRMTPQDLTAIGCKSPATRKKLLLEIKKLNIEDDIPETRPDSFEKWLHQLKLIEYYPRLCAEGYDTIDKVCDLTWEDLEEIGITKLGHQKRLLLGIDKLRKKAEKQDEFQHDNQSIYDVHPNHRVTLNKNHDGRVATLSRSTSRSGFFHTRSGANLDHRGLPVATVMPALKHINAHISPELKTSDMLVNGDDQDQPHSNNLANNRLSTNTTYGSYQQSFQNNAQDNPRSSINDFCTMKRNPPPLPPMRTNSLKLTPSNDMNYNNSIYGNTGTFASNNLNSSTSFLRTPKIGTLTATTNKMLTSGGHIRTITGSQTLMRTVMPVREAPAPPSITNNVGVPEKIDEEPSMQMQSFASPIDQTLNNQSLTSTSLISHQLAGADEFPPPPPST